MQADKEAPVQLGAEVKEATMGWKEGEKKERWCGLKNFT